ncbi:MAG: hypothetical protein MZV63_29895 [Marinilabiliales bacterium]|nr:hypothetical protein [Marinilabiliales bacterium]
MLTMTTWVWADRAHRAGLPDTVAIHYGADDNASGVALMIRAGGETCCRAEMDHARNIVFVAFSRRGDGAPWLQVLCREYGH